MPTIDTKDDTYSYTIAHKGITVGIDGLELTGAVLEKHGETDPTFAELVAVFNSCASYDTEPDPPFKDQEKFAIAIRVISAMDELGKEQGSPQTSPPRMGGSPMS